MIFLGQVNINDPVNSITKETVINYLRDNRVGFAVTGGSSVNAVSQPFHQT